jgi:hypothetical protein
LPGSACGSTHLSSRSKINASVIEEEECCMFE